MKKTIVFIASLGARNKKAGIFHEIVSLCPESDYSSVLYITPTAFGGAEAKRQFFSYLKSAHKKTTYIPFQSIPLRELCLNLYEVYGEKIIISERIEPIFLCEILGGRNFGYAVLLAELFGKFRNYLPDKDLQEIKGEIKKLIFEEKALKRALQAIEWLEIYEKKLKDSGLIDSEGVLRESIPLINKYLNPPVLVLDGFFDPTPLELKIIEALIKKAGIFIILVEEEAEFLRFLESHLEIEKRHLRPVIRRESAGYYPYPSMEDEVEGIARWIKKLILDGTKPEEIIVTFPQPSRYLPMLKRVFQRHGIPLSIAQYELSSTGPIIALEDMLTSIEEDYPRNDFLSFLKSSYFPGISEILREWVEIYSSRAGIVKGRKAWLSMRGILLNSMEEISPQERKLINGIQKGINSVIVDLERLRQAKDLSSFIDELELVLSKFGFWDSLMGETQISEAINNRLSELRHFSGVSGSILMGMEALPYLRHLLKGLKGREEAEGVRVVPYEFAAGLEAKAVFSGGMIEGEFPSTPQVDPILPECVKKALGIPFFEYYLDRQRRYFKRLLNVSQDEPYFSYPSMDGDKVFLPSPFLEWGMSLTPPALNILTEEEIMIGEGMLKQKDFAEVLLGGQLLEGTEIRSLLKISFGEDVFISVTNIDAYRRCPLRFYIERVVGLGAELPPRFEVEQRLWGRLAHRVMEHLYSDGEIELEDINKRIMQGLDMAIKEFPIGDFWSKVAREIFVRLAPMIEAVEKELRMEGFSPYIVEKKIKAEINGLRLKGKIDRIDIKKPKIPNPKSQKEDKVILLDYKTGSIDKDSLQLPLYAAMWKKGCERVGFYSLRDGTIEWYPAKGYTMKEFTENALKVAKELIERLRSGIFAPTPLRDTECRYCYHSPLCAGSR